MSSQKTGIIIKEIEKTLRYDLFKSLSVPDTLIRLVPYILFYHSPLLTLCTYVRILYINIHFFFLILLLVFYFHLHTLFHDKQSAVIASTALSFLGRVLVYVLACWNYCTTVIINQIIHASYTIETDTHPQLYIDQNFDSRLGNLVYLY